MLESARKKTAPRRVDLYEVFCAVLYLLRTGCQWRALPGDFPKWCTVHSYWTIWSEPRAGGSLLEQALKNQVNVAAREKQGPNACSTLLIVDAQSVKNTDTATLKGYDAGKQVSGIKRHIAVDTQRLPHTVTVTTVEVTQTGKKCYRRRAAVNPGSGECTACSMGHRTQFRRAEKRIEDCGRTASE